MAIIQKTKKREREKETITGADEDVEKLEPWIITGGNMKWGWCYKK